MFSKFYAWHHCPLSWSNLKPDHHLADILPPLRPPGQQIIVLLFGPLQYRLFVSLSCSLLVWAPQCLSGIPPAPQPPLLTAVHTASHLHAVPSWCLWLHRSPPPVLSPRDGVVICVTCGSDYVCSSRPRRCAKPRSQCPLLFETRPTSWKAHFYYKVLSFLDLTRSSVS